MSSQADLKLVLLGHKNVGKTSIFNRYLYDEFGKTSMTIGAYFGMKACRVHNKPCNLAIWDTAGEEKFDSLTSFYCRNARAALVCYDITSYESFKRLDKWISKVEVEAEPGCCIVIVGNKLDIVEQNPALRQVDFSEAKRYAASVNAEVIEVSAKTGAQVNKAFARVVELCMQNAEPTPANNPSLDLNQQKQDSKTSSNPCC